jgi:O-antigen/teichoic acid export membrane protein
MKQHLPNVLYGVVDYLAYPAAMLLAAPIVLHNLSITGYGVWSVATAVISGGSIVASGFSDANTKQVSEQRSHGNRDAVILTVRTLMGLNLVLASVASLAVLLFAGIAARHVVPGAGQLQDDCILSLQLAALLLGLRAIESVCISTQRAYEHYGAAVRISVVARLLSLLAGALLTYRVHFVAAILMAALVINAFSLLLQFQQLRYLLDAQTLLPVFRSNATGDFFRFGSYSWLLALAGVLFGQVDRIALGIWFGAASVAGYSLCTQLAQPIYGIAAAGLHFLFPHLANRVASSKPSALRRPIAIAAVVNLIFVGVAALFLQVYGSVLLTWLSRGTLTDATRSMLGPIAWSSALLGLGVTPTYALYAFNHIKTVAAYNIAGAITCALVMVWLGRVVGISGVVWARLIYGLAAVSLYLPLIRILRNYPNDIISASTTRLCEEL